MKIIVCPYCHKEIEIHNPRKMSGVERKLEKFLLKHKLPFKFVGHDRKFKIAGHTPDFIDTDGSKRIIEVFGALYHKEYDEEELKEEYKKAGYKLLVLWDFQIEKIQSNYLAYNKFFAEERTIPTGQLYFMIHDF